MTRNLQRNSPWSTKWDLSPMANARQTGNAHPSHARSLRVQSLSRSGVGFPRLMFELGLELIAVVVSTRRRCWTGLASSPFAFQRWRALEPSDAFVGFREGTENGTRGPSSVAALRRVDACAPAKDACHAAWQSRL